MLVAKQALEKEASIIMRTITHSQRYLLHEFPPDTMQSNWLLRRQHYLRLQTLSSLQILRPAVEQKYGNTNEVTKGQISRPHSSVHKAKHISLQAYKC